MKTVKEIALGVAVAGMVAGAGTTVACAVAYADAGPADSASSSDNAGPAAKAGARGRQATRSQSAPAAAGSNTSGSRGTGRADSPRAAAGATKNRGGAPTQISAVTAATAGASDSTDIETPSVALDAPDATPTQNLSAPAPQAYASAASNAPAPLAAVRVAKAVLETTSLLTAAVTPLTPDSPQLPLPTPALPVAPASSVNTTSSSNSRSRTAAATANASIIGDPAKAHVLLIGTDGTNLDKILADPANVGFFDLMGNSVTGATSIVGHTTISGPSWSTIMTGVWDNKTGVINNLFNPEPYKSWPTAINQLEYYNSGIRTAVVADWKYINDMAGAGGFPADVNTYVAPVDGDFATSDAQVVADTIDLITNAASCNTPNCNSATFIFSYQVQVDEAGHSFGGGSAEYKQAVTNVSNNIADIMTAVDLWNADPAHADENWTVIVTTDHGHQQSVGFGHGFQSPNETSSFVIFQPSDGSTAGQNLQNMGFSNVDITPTIVGLFGAPTRSDFDGVSLLTKTSSQVQAADLAGLKQSLNDAVDSFGYPNIGTDLALGTRTIFASVPYFLDGFFKGIEDNLQSLVDKNIFLLSAVAAVTQALVGITGDITVGITQAIARVVAHLTGSGVIAPTDPPLGSSAANALPASVLV